MHEMIPRSLCHFIQFPTFYGVCLFVISVNYFSTKLIDLSVLFILQLASTGKIIFQ